MHKSHSGLVGTRANSSSYQTGNKWTEYTNVLWSEMETKQMSERMPSAARRLEQPGLQTCLYATGVWIHIYITKWLIFQMVSYLLCALYSVMYVSLSRSNVPRFAYFLLWKVLFSTLIDVLNNGKWNRTDAYKYRIGNMLCFCFSAGSWIT